jgi:xanthine dehydrogenase molybdopterin-binding subunit B
MPGLSHAGHPEPIHRLLLLAQFHSSRNEVRRVRWMALLEEVVVEDGVNLTAGFFQYLIPTTTDVPDIEVVVLESGEGMGPFGARGIGEPPIGPPAAAVASAIHDALGSRPTVLPITPERVLECAGALTGLGRSVQR